MAESFQVLTPEQEAAVRGLRFESELETAFRHAQFEANLPALRITGFVGIAVAIGNSLLVGFGLYDASMRANVLTFAIWISAALAVPLVLSYTKTAARTMPIAFAACFPAFLVILGLTLHGLPVLDQVRNGVGVSLLVTACLYLLARLPFRWAIVSGLAAFVAFLVFVLPAASPDARTTAILVLLIAMMHLFGAIALFQSERLARRAYLLQGLLQVEQQKTQELLVNVLPRSIAERLKTSAEIIADSHEDASVLFADIVDFTPYSRGRPPAEVVRHLNDLFSEFDRLVILHGLEKIKTIGDAYMVAGGIPDPSDDHLVRMADLALDLRDAAERMGAKVRIGLHCGPLVAGVIGSKKLLYDLWGDTVNTASRMESHGSPGMIHVTAHAANLLRDRFAFQPRGLIELKGIGSIETYAMERC